MAHYIWITIDTVSNMPSKQRTSINNPKNNRYITREMHGCGNKNELEKIDNG
jgi:hypothetical protein